MKYFLFFYWSVIVTMLILTIGITATTAHSEPIGTQGHVTLNVVEMVSQSDCSKRPDLDNCIPAHGDMVWESTDDYRARVEAIRARPSPDDLNNITPASGDENAVSTEQK